MTHVCPEHGPVTSLTARGPTDVRLSCGCRVTTIQGGSQ